MQRGVPPTSTHPLETPCPPASTPRPLPGWHPTSVPHYHGFASCWGCSPGAARKTAKPTHPALGASPRETGAVFDRIAANLRHGKGGKQRVVPITDTVDDDEIRAAMTAAVAVCHTAVTAPRPGQPGHGTRPLAAARTPRHHTPSTPKSYARQHNRKAGARPACARRRAGDRAGNAPAAEPSTNRWCSGQARRLRACINHRPRGTRLHPFRRPTRDDRCLMTRAQSSVSAPSSERTSSVLGRSRPALPETRCRLPIGARELRLGPPDA